MKWFTSFSVSFLVILSVVFSLFGFINDTYAETQTFTYSPGDTVTSFGFDFSHFDSPPLYFSYSCLDNSSFDTINMSIRLNPSVPNSFALVCRNFNSTVKTNSGMIVLDYIPSLLSFFNPFTVPSTVSAITFTLSDSFGSVPSGSLSITENGTFDVTNYAEAVVDVPISSGDGGGNYHDDLVSINNSILICAAVCLVLYFFYCIYRMIIKSTGGF